MRNTAVVRSGKMVPNGSRIGVVLVLLVIAMVGAPPADATGLREIPARDEPLTPLEPSSRVRPDPALPPAPEFRVAVVTRDSRDNPLRRGAISAAGDLVEIVDPGRDPENALDLQINLVENAINAMVDGIILDPLHPDGLAPYVERARTAGIAVITVNNPVATALVNTHVSTDHSAAGVSVVDRLLHLVGSDAVVAILGDRSPGGRASERREGFLLRLRERYPDIRVVEPARGEVSTEEEALAATLDMIAANPEVRGILAIDEPATLGAGRAVARTGLAGEVAVVGFDPGPGGMALLQAGAVQGFLVEDEYRIGHTALVRMVEILRGGTVPPTVVVPYRFAVDHTDMGGRYSR